MPTRQSQNRGDNAPNENRGKNDHRDRFNRRDRSRNVEEPVANGKMQYAEAVITPAINGADGVAAPDDAFYLPQIGVEIVDTNERNGNRFYSVRDLRNGHIIKNVTRRGARKLWNYAIQQYEDRPSERAKIEWRGNVGLVGLEKRAGKTRYDLALREGERIRIFYGVTDDGMEGEWATFVQED